MKKIILTLFTAIAFINVNGQCNSNPISNNGASGTLSFSDSSSVSNTFSTNYSVSYLWDFGDGFTSTQQSPCHTYGDLSNVSFPLYATLTVTYFDSTTINYCIDTDSVPVTIFINPCLYGDLQISVSGNNLSADWTYSIGGTSGCANNYPSTYLWSNGDTTQTTSVNSPGTYTCTVTTTTGCVYTSTYSYNGSLTLTFDCSQMDIFEANDDYNVLSFQSSYINNNVFPELIDSLSFWEAYTPDGNVCGLYPMMWQGAPSTMSFQNSNFNGVPSDSMYICHYAYLYDSLYQFNNGNNGSTQLGSICYDCELFIWVVDEWIPSVANTTWDCDPIIGCYDAGPSGGGAFTSYAACDAFCSSSWSISYCDSLEVSVVGSSADSITLGTNLSLLGFTGTSQYEWTEFTNNGFGSINTSATPTFAINIGDTNVYLLQLTIADNSGMNWICIYPTLVFWDGSSWIALRTSQPTSLNPETIFNARKLLRITDVIGRETTFKANEVQFYIYDDGSIEKKYIID
jgi:hypothetical protein|tara:strand:- start:2888 stop:4429 length:1542 start_codon:yes stop_codon:yes gene_type:complete